jgi:hypothetical protein
MGAVKGIKELGAATTWSSQPSLITTIQADINYLKGLITLQKSLNPIVAPVFSVNF